MKVVEVVWGDAHVSTSDVSIKKAQSIKPVMTVTIGFLVADNDDGLVIAMDRWPSEPKDVKVHTFIPWGMIEEYYEWRD